MKDALAIHRNLLERETPHEIVRLPSAITNADELPGMGLPPDRCLATRLFSVIGTGTETGTETGPATGTEPHAIVLLAAVVVRAAGTAGTEQVRRAVGARAIRRATADLINKVTDYAAELVCPLLLPDSVSVLIDRRLTTRLRGDDVVYLATGEPCTALGIRAVDFHVVSGARPIDLRPVITSAAPLPHRSHRARRATR